MKRWLCAAVCAASLLAGSLAAAEDLRLPGGLVMPLDGTAISPAETSPWGSLLAGALREAVTEESLRGAIKSLRLYGAGESADGNRLARLLADILREGRLIRLETDGGEAFLFSVYAGRAEEEDIAALLEKADLAALPFMDGKNVRRGASLGRFSPAETAPVGTGVSEAGIRYRWGEASLVFDGGWHMTMPFLAVYMAQEGSRGTVYTLAVTLLSPADFLPRLTAGLSDAREESGEEEQGCGNS